MALAGGGAPGQLTLPTLIVSVIQRSSDEQYNGESVS
jgi:hypothetical protein